MNYSIFMLKIDEKTISFPPLEKIILPVAFFIVVVAIIVSSFFYLQYRKSKELLADPKRMSQEQIKLLTEKVGKLMELPKEEPTVATVLEKNKLKNQLFFVNAENEDKVLIFTQAKKAILYRPSENKIIEVAPITIGPQSTPSATVSVSAVKIAVYNGTKTTGLAGSYATQIQDKFSNVSITLKSNAKGDFGKTIVVDLSGKNKDLAQKIAQLFSGEVANLPAGEEKPAADILVIAGK